MMRYPHGTVVSRDNPNLGSSCQQPSVGNLQKLLNEFADVLQDKPGKTIMVEHTINTGTANPGFG